MTQNAYRMRRLQPSQDENDACFMAYQSEPLSYSYEEEPEDPRIVHQFNLEVDNYSNLREACTIAYPRRSSDDRLPAQERFYITATRQDYLIIDNSDRRELAIPTESKAFEVAGLTIEESDSLFQYHSLRTTLRTVLASAQDFHELLSPEATTLQARLIGWSRNYYWNDNQTGALPWEEVGEQTLLHHTESACFTNELITDTLGDRVNASLLEEQGYYYFDSDYWWQRGETYHYLSNEEFFLLSQIERLDGGSTLYRYDEPYFLTLVSVEDALGNQTQAEIDYHLIAPFQITDINDNVAEVLYDPLGMIIVSTSQGSIQDEDDNEQPYGNDRFLSIYKKLIVCI